MTRAEKVEMVKTMMYIPDKSEDDVIAAYLLAAEREIIDWRYSYASEKPTEVPQEYEMT